MSAQAQQLQSVGAHVEETQALQPSLRLVCYRGATQMPNTASFLVDPHYTRSSFARNPHLSALLLKARGTLKMPLNSI